MNIIVTVKQVADPNIPPSDIQLDPAALRIVSPFGVAPVMNGYDANALEEALTLSPALRASRASMLKQLARDLAPSEWLARNLEYARVAV